MYWPLRGLKGLFQKKKVPNTIGRVRIQGIEPRLSIGAMLAISTPIRQEGSPLAGKSIAFSRHISKSARPNSTLQSPGWPEKLIPKNML